MYHPTGSVPSFVARFPALEGTSRPTQQERARFTDKQTDGLSVLRTKQSRTTRHSHIDNLISRRTRNIHRDKMECNLFYYNAWRNRLLFGAGAGASARGDSKSKNLARALAKIACKSLRACKGCEGNDLPRQS